MFSSACKHVTPRSLKSYLLPVVYWHASSYTSLCPIFQSYSSGLLNNELSHSPPPVGATKFLPQHFYFSTEWITKWHIRGFHSPLPYRSIPKWNYIAIALHFPFSPTYCAMNQAEFFSTIKCMAPIGPQTQARGEALVQVMGLGTSWAWTQTCHLCYTKVDCNWAL